MTEDLENQVANGEINSQGNQNPAEQNNDNSQIQNTTIEINDELVFNYLKEKTGREISSYDDLVSEKIVEVEKEIEKVVDKYEGVDFDDEDQAYFEFKKQTGGNRKDFDFVKQDIESLSLIDLATKRLQKDIGIKPTANDVKEFLEDKFNIDLTEGESNLSFREKADLLAYVKPVKDELLQQQETIKNFKPTPKPEPTATTENGDVVTLEDGTIMPKAKYESLVQQRQSYLENLTTSVDGVGEVGYQIAIDDNGTERLVDCGYEFSNEDRQAMLSDITDINATMEKRYRTEKGFDTEQFAVDMFFSRPENREKVLSSFYHKGRADAIAELMKVENNVNFSTGQLPNQDLNHGKYQTQKVSLQNLLNT